MNGLLQIVIANWHYVAASICIIYLLKQYFNNGLQSIPGPFLAKFTNIWRFLKVHDGDFHTISINLHKAHGDFVRLGPNLVSISDIQAIKEIYGFGSKGLPKSAFYEAFSVENQGRKLPPNLFAVRDDKIHGEMRRPVAGAYSMTTLVEYEPLVNVVIEEFLQALELRYGTYRQDIKECDISAWLQYYAFDVIGQITWGEPLGFIQRGSDIDGAINELDRFQTYGAVIGQMPFLHKILRQNRIAYRFDKSTGFFPRIALGRIQQRQKEVDVEHNDFLTRFLKAAKQSPDIVDPPMLVNYTLNNIIAGSDTTGISLSAVVYYVIKTPHVLDNLLKELDSANISTPVSWSDSQRLPYLDAIIKEALRLHSAVGLGLERVVTNSGLRLSNGKHLPSGTLVSMNPWVIHRNKEIFGADAEQFNPSRWLRDSKYESPEVYQARLAAMKRVDLVFGGGPRTCLGKNISLLEIYKVIPTLFLKFDVRLVNPDKDWKIFNGWFVRQTDMNVYLTVRKTAQL